MMGRRGHSKCMRSGEPRYEAFTVTDFPIVEVVDLEYSSDGKEVETVVTHHVVKQRVSISTKVYEIR